MQRWAEEHGGVPPSCADWCHAGPDHPHAHATKRHGGWNELLLRAGFALRCDRRPETYEWIVDQLQRGVPTAEIAHALGVSVACIYERLKYRGLTVTGVRNGVAA